MRKIIILFALCLSVSILHAQSSNQTGETCADAVTLEYGADFTIDDVFWIRQKAGILDEDGLSAFWYSTDSLFIEAFFATGGSWGQPVTCTSIGLSIVTPPNAKILIDKGSLIKRIEAQVSNGTLTETEKNMVLSSYVYLSLEPRAKGRFIFNRFGVAAGSDCFNPWVVDLGAVYGLTEEANVLRLDPMKLDSLHVSYEPMRASDTDYTLMNVEVRFGECDAPIVQKGQSLSGLDEGLFIPRKTLLDSVAALNKPLYFIVNRGKDPATVAFRMVKNDTVSSEIALCEGKTVNVNGKSVSNTGVYTFETRVLSGPYAIYRHHIVNVVPDEDCPPDALEDITGNYISVRPTAVATGQDIEVVAHDADKVEVFDITGRCLQSVSFSGSTTLRINNPGEYFLRINGNMGLTRKIIVF